MQTPNDTKQNQADPAAIVIFGASGDLTRRKLVPALHSLACGGILHPDTQVIGVARSPLADEPFRERLYAGVEDYARLKPGVCELWPSLSQRHSYLAGSYDHPEMYRHLAADGHTASLFPGAAAPGRHHIGRSASPWNCV